jgi:hypothetical protein
MATANADVSDSDLPTNLLYPSIRLLVRGEVSGGGGGDKVHLPLQEHAYRIANEPNTFFYVLPHDVGDYEVAVFVRNFGSRDVALVQRCVSMEEGGDMRCVCPANAEVCFELPRRLSDCDDGVDILNGATEEVLMRLRFDGKPIPADFVPFRRTGMGWTRTRRDEERHDDLQGLLCRLLRLNAISMFI